MEFFLDCYYYLVLFFCKNKKQKQGQPQYDYQVKCRKVPAGSSIQDDNYQGNKKAKQTKKTKHVHVISKNLKDTTVHSGRIHTCPV